MKKALLGVVAVLLLAGSVVGQNKVSCYSLENLNMTVCEKVSQGHHTYTVEERSSTSVTIKPITAARATELAKLEAAHVTSDLTLQIEKAELDLKLSLQRLAIAECAKTDPVPVGFTEKMGACIQDSRTAQANNVSQAVWMAAYDSCTKAANPPSECLQAKYKAIDARIEAEIKEAIAKLTPTK